MTKDEIMRMVKANPVMVALFITIVIAVLLIVIMSIIDWRTKNLTGKDKIASQATSDGFQRALFWTLLGGVSVSLVMLTMEAKKKPMMHEAMMMKPPTEAVPLVSAPTLAPMGAPAPPVAFSFRR